MDMLTHYTERAADMGDFALHFALRDVVDTMKLWKHESPQHPYNAKLHAEFDAYTVELERRRAARAAKRKGRAN